MNWKSWIFLTTITIISIGVFFIYGNLLFRDTISTNTKNEQSVLKVGELTTLTEPLITFIDPFKGAKDGDILIVEYGDHSCVFCRDAEVDIDLLIAEQPNNIKFVWKDLPNPLYTGSDLAAEAAHCAKDQGKYWEFHGLLLEQPTVYTETSLSLLANDIRLELNEFTQCLTSRKKRAVVQHSVEEARMLGIESIPYFFINGKPYSGQLSYEQLREAIK